MFKPNSLFKHVVLFYNTYYVYILFLIIQNFFYFIILCIPFCKYNFEILLINILTVYYLFNVYHIFSNKKYLININNTLTINMYLFLLYIINNGFGYNYCYNFLKNKIYLTIYFFYKNLQILVLVSNIKNL